MRCPSSLATSSSWSIKLGPSLLASPLSPAGFDGGLGRVSGASEEKLRVVSGSGARGELRFEATTIPFRPGSCSCPSPQSPVLARSRDRLRCRLRLVGHEAAAAAGSRSSPWSDIFDFFSLDASACWWRLFPKKSGCGCSCRPPAHSVMVVVPEEIKIPESEVEERSRGWVRMMQVRWYLR